MDSYTIIMTPDANDDLTALQRYITDVLCAPGTALACVRAVRGKIAGLSEMPARYRTVDEEPWHSRAVRRILVRNYYVYYRIDESAKKVYILNVIYARRDQLRALNDQSAE